MSAEIASLEKVKGAVASIRAQGGTATADRVIAHLGGGSKATVLRHIRTLREAEPSGDLLPQTVLDMAKAALSDIYTAGVSAGTERGAAGLARLTTAIAELDAQVDELAAENAGLQTQLDTVSADHAKTTRALESLRDELTAANRDLQAAKNELAVERRGSAEKLGALMLRLEASVNSISRTHTATQKQRDRRSQ